MKLSINWLNDYVDLKKISTDDLVNKLTMSTCEVDDIQTPYAFLKDVVTSKVVKKEKHPDADKLSICFVDAGEAENLQIVCGATNVTENMWVALAKTGASIPLKNGEVLKIKSAKLRGVMSNGMLCAASELGLQDFCDNENGLMDLKASGFIQDDSYTGMALTELLPLHDTILDIDNKSITHRPDLWCHFGFAREIASIYSLPIIFDPLDEIHIKNKNFNKGLKPDSTLPAKKILIQDDSAINYNAVQLSGVKVVESPILMKIRLSAVGQKPVNNIVDCSNYAMLETGQPNHAFDFSTLKEKTIGVCKNGKSVTIETLKTLDGQIHLIPGDAVLITDGVKKNSRVVALAGIMGGSGSEISANTTELFLESATFPRELIRRTVSQTGIRTDSSQRFEKGQDPNKSFPLLVRLMALISQSLPNQKISYSQTISQSSRSAKTKKNIIKISHDFIQKRLGFKIKKKQIIDILERLHFMVDIKSDEFIITIPGFRSQYDITIPEDIVEELGRIHGYDNIEPIAPAIELNATRPNLERKLQDSLKKALSGQGYSECYNYSFSDQNDTGLFLTEKMIPVEIANPVFGDRPYLRTSQIPGLLRNVVKNQDRFDTVDLYEFARIYFKNDKMKIDGDPGNPGELAKEEKHIDMVHTIPNSEKKQKIEEVLNHNFGSYQNMRNIIYKILKPFINDINFISIEKNELSFLHPRCCAQIYSDQTLLGYIGLLHPQLQSYYQLKRQAVIAHLNFNQVFKIYDLVRTQIQYKPPSVFQDSNFDLSVLLDQNQGSHIPVEIIHSLNIEQIDQIEYLDSYQGENLPDNKKSVSYRITCSNRKDTISNEQLQIILDKCVLELKKNSIYLR